ncbi:S-methyl-5-thioribose kinase [Paenibacillus sp. MWE-103]|uniref:Methylthioribose kinase n=1 Tax=Paenibacillus artemisiicola TaxID=1172618 RepID=A0ABS3WDR7_9BACL|nr:S-methyl-5-thioribose kinase [Paenibacillus artemisiicola]MBO7746468.1 S-methyl-5-thioribose kinase [Paenibacillus artemisiicola]
MLQYETLNEYRALMYARKLKDMFGKNAQLVCREIGDGNLNLVFQITDKLSGTSIIVKQALTYARVVGESWPLTLDRARIESQALIIQHSICPGFVPKVYHYDPIMAVTVMEDLSNYLIMRKGLAARKRYPHFARHLGVYLARTLYLTSDFALPSQVKKKKAAQFTNPEMCKISEDLIFTDPYFNSETNQFNPLAAERIEEIWNNNPLKLEVAKLKAGFLTHAEALIHGDLHTGSIMVSEEGTKVIDPEFSFYGPVGFDIGVVFGNLLLSFVSHGGHTQDAPERNYQAYLLATIEQIWGYFEQTFRELWEKESKERMTIVPGLLDSYLLHVLEDCAGYAGCEMIRRIIGLAHVSDLESIADPNLRAEGEKLALSIGQKLVLERRQIQDIKDVTCRVSEIAGYGTNQ